MESTTAGHGRTPTAFDREVGRRLKARRQSWGWSLEGLEERSGGRFRVSAVRAYESGIRRPPLETLCALAAIFQVPVSALMPNSPGGPTLVPLDDVIQMLQGLRSGAAPVAVPEQRDGSEIT